MPSFRATRDLLPLDLECSTSFIVEEGLLKLLPLLKLKKDMMLRDAPFLSYIPTELPVWGVGDPYCYCLRWYTAGVFYHRTTLSLSASA